jgi:hypothetical protein
MQSARWPVSLLGALVLGACGGNGATSSTGALLPLVQSDSPSRQLTGAFQSAGRPYLFATYGVFNQYHAAFGEYSLPLRDGEKASVKIKASPGLDEPVPIAVDARDLYVGGFNNGEVYTYRLPLREAQNSLYSTRLPYVQFRGALSSLAIDDGYIFATSSNEVLAYVLPLIPGEKPSATLNLQGAADYIELAAAKDTLYAASSTYGTVTAYQLPLTYNEAPEFTIITQPQTDYPGEHEYCRRSQESPPVHRPSVAPVPVRISAAVPDRRTP